MSWINRLLGSLRKSELEEELDDELRFHIEMRMQEFMAAGMKPDEPASVRYAFSETECC